MSCLFFIALFLFVLFGDHFLEFCSHAFLLSNFFRVYSTRKSSLGMIYILPVEEGGLWSAY